MMATRTGPIVLGFNPTDAADAAMRWAADQASLTRAEIIVVHVISANLEMGLGAVQIDTSSIERDARRRLEEIWTASLRERGLPFRTYVAEGRVAEELIRIARAEEASLIVIGMTGRGTLSELIFGSVHHDLVRHAVRPVVAVPPPPRDGS